MRTYEMKKMPHGKITDNRSKLRPGARPVENKIISSPFASPHAAFLTASFLCAATLISLLSGCGGSATQPATVNPTGVASLPPASPTTPSNVYVGTQGPGVWSLSLDDSKDTYSYQPITFPGSPNTPITGTFKPVGGFLSLGTTNGSSLGYVLEIPSRLAILRPGDTTAPLVVSVPQTACYSLPYRLRFAFVGMQAGAADDAAIVPLAYGSFVGNTNTEGSDWQFQNLQGNAPAGPATFSGACASTNGEAAISLSGEGIINQYNFSGSVFSTLTNISTTFEMGPTGIFVVDQSNPAFASAPGLSPGTAAAGVAQPTSPLTTSAVAAGQYLGFLTEAASAGNGGTATPIPNYTSPVSFGQTPSSGSTMTGGIFPNDDVTQAPNADIQINLGSQDGTINGFYPSATVTTLDPAQNCATDTVAGIKGVTAGINVQGYVTCTYPATAVVGNPEGKYAIFLNAYNFTANKLGAPMQIYIYQQ